MRLALDAEWHEVGVKGLLGGRGVLLDDVDEWVGVADIEVKLEGLD